MRRKRESACPQRSNSKRTTPTPTKWFLMLPSENRCFCNLFPHGNALHQAAEKQQGYKSKSFYIELLSQNCAQKICDCTLGCVVPAMILMPFNRKSPLGWTSKEGAGEERVMLGLVCCASIHQLQRIAYVQTQVEQLNILTNTFVQLTQSRNQQNKKIQINEKWELTSE